MDYLDFFHELLFREVKCTLSCLDSFYYYAILSRCNTACLVTEKRPIVAIGYKLGLRDCKSHKNFPFVYVYTAGLEVFSVATSSSNCI